MKKCLGILMFLVCLKAEAQNAYFFPEGNFDPAIPTPEQFLGYPIGDWHTRHENIVAYYRELARVSTRAHFQIIGYTTEHRAQIILTVTNPENYTHLEELRQDHLKLADPSKTVELTKMPVVVLLGYNVHGNEPSSSEAAMLTAYYMVASQREEVNRYLNESVLLFDPNYNPDGRDRHSNWVNMHKGYPPVADPMDREHNEVWPGGRFNHYWFDLNRDWLPLVHVETQNRAKFYHQWLPNVGTDYHEMQTSGTNFFEPTKPYGAENPVIPRSNYDGLNVLFAKYFSKALDDIGSLYFTKEVFDNSYPGYGSTYPDIQGGLGLVFEQASSRGHVQRSPTKDVVFAFTIRNHVRTGLATIQAAVENRAILLKYQQDFFKTAVEEARKSAVKAYVFGDNRDQGRTRAFADLLLQHHIEAYPLTSDVSVGSTQYEKGVAFVVPTDQPQYRMVRSIFEKVTQFADSIFYDASSWTMTLAYNMPNDALAATVKYSKGERLKRSDLVAASRSVTKSNYAYLIDWRDYYAPQLLFRLQSNKIFVKAAFKPFSAKLNNATKNFGYGTLIISVADQNMTPDELYAHINDAAMESGVEVHAVSTGFSADGIDLGSNNVRSITMPKIAMLVGDGTAATEAGEVWYLLDSKLQMPMAKVNANQFTQLRITDYNTLIMVSGNYAMLGEAGIAKIKTWVQQGGTLILFRNAVSWAIQNKLVEEQLRKEEEPAKKEAKRLDYVTAQDYTGARATGGSVYLTNLDITHPLGFGYTRRDLPVYRNHSVFLEAGKNPFNTVARYTSAPRISGYVHPVNLEKIKNTVSLSVSSIGQGRAILFVDDPTFRGFWYGTNKLLFNAIFFGANITTPNIESGEE